jgi:hypothetical protein
MAALPDQCQDRRRLRQVAEIVEEQAGGFVVEDAQWTEDQRLDCSSRWGTYSQLSTGDTAPDGEGLIASACSPVGARQPQGA